MLKLAIVTILGAAALPAYAQHPSLATYDSSRKVRLKGSVTRIDWVNPHAFFFINVQDSTGTTVNWALEIGNPFDLEKDGWKRTTLRIGDVVSVDAVPARNPGRQAVGTSVLLGRTGAK